MSETAPPKDHRSLAIGLAVAAASLLVYAAFTRQWLASASPNLDIQIGLRSITMCGDGGRLAGLGFSGEHACTELSNAAFVQQWRDLGEARSTSSAFAPVGWATFVAVLLGAAGLLAAAALAQLRKHPELPVAPTTIGLLGLMAALITGCVFVATKPGPGGYVGVGLSFWLFGVGCVMGIAGAQMLAKLNRPPEPDWTVDAGGDEPT